MSLANPLDDVESHQWRSRNNKNRIARTVLPSARAAEIAYFGKRIEARCSSQLLV
jgi:hypothetical protein